MLSLPPAFVLSQDQTLKLRIQSVTNHYRSESTRTFMYTRNASQRSSFHGSLISKRDRHFVFQTDPLKDPRDAADHVSLSSHLQLSKNRRSNLKRQKRQQPQRPNRNPVPISIPANFPEISLERKSSSPAAPPPSSVRRFINPSHKTSQHYTP